MKKNMNQNIITTQKYEKYCHDANNMKNRKNMKSTKYMGWGWRLGKPQLHWMILLIFNNP